MVSQQIVRWKDVRDEVSALNPELSKIIDELNPGNEFTFSKVIYPYGAEILHKAELQLPTTEHTLLPLKSNLIDAKIQEQLGYNFGSNPVAILLKNTIELFITLDERIIPYSVVYPGRVFGAWRILDTSLSHSPATFMWGMTAGACSLFMLPKISETNSHNQLRKKFRLSIEKPTSLFDHGKIFKELVGFKKCDDIWNVELLFFTKKWFEKLHDDAWIKFKCYLLDKMWQGSSYWRNQHIWKFIFSLIHKYKNIKISSHIIDIVQHILSIGIGVVPGFRPAIDDSLAPISQIQQIYVDYYNLKNYVPIIMQPETFNMYDNNGRSIYYSLQYPTAIEFSPKSSERTSTLTDLYSINLLLKKYLSELRPGSLSLDTTPLADISRKVKFDFFHNSTHQYHDVQDSSFILNGDHSFKQACANYGDRIFPKNSSFFNGCIRLSTEIEKS